MQGTERRIACAEIVNAKSHAQVAQLGQHFAGGVYVFNDDTFGDLQFQAPRIEIGLSQYVFYEIDQIRLGKLFSRKIDAHRQVFIAGIELLPGASLMTRFAQNPLPNRQDQAGVLCHRDELCGTDQTLSRMFPAGQCFKPGDLERVERHDRLILNEQFLLFDCLSQIILHLEQLDRAYVHTSIKYLVTAAAQ